MTIKPEREHSHPDLAGTSTRQIAILKSDPELIHSGMRGEVGPLYTRLLATTTDGPSQGALLLTAEVYRDVGEAGPAFPIWKSNDNGSSWDHIADVTDQRFGFGNRYQPSLYELPRAFGGLSRGALLLVGSAIPNDMSETHLVMYVSEDCGLNWRFCSEVDAGGPAIYDADAKATTTAVWEPTVYLAGDRLVCAYADERYKDQSMLQTIVHRTTTDLKTWSDKVIDFGVPDQFTRPGMFVCSGQLPDGTYIGVLEVVGPPEVPIRLCTSIDGLDWGAADHLGERLRANDGTVLSGSPNIYWRQGPDGRLEVLVTGRLSLSSDGAPTNMALYSASGACDDWQSIPLPVETSRDLESDNSGYSQSLVWAADGSIIQATTVRNGSGSHDIVVARASIR